MHRPIIWVAHSPNKLKSGRLNVFPEDLAQAMPEWDPVLFKIEFQFWWREGMWSYSLVFWQLSVIECFDPVQSCSPAQLQTSFGGASLWRPVVSFCKMGIWMDSFLLGATPHPLLAALSSRRNWNAVGWLCSSFPLSDTVSSTCLCRPHSSREGMNHLTLRRWPWDVLFSWLLGH